MAWFKVDDGFATSRPVLQIPRRYRSQAVGLWVLAGSWAAKELTDGHVPDYVVTEICASTPAIAKHLVSVGLWVVCSDRGGFLFVGWSKYQPTKEQVLTSRAEEAERRRRGREAQRKAAEQGKDDDVREMSGRTKPGHGPDTARTPMVPTRPDPSRPVLSLVTSGGDVALVDAPEPPTRCQSHILEATPPRCGRCADARKAHEAWTRAKCQNAQRRKAEIRAAIDDCGLCDEYGDIAVGDNAIRKCHHQQREEINA